MNAECKRIFGECRTKSKLIKGSKTFPKSAIIVYDSSITPEQMHFPVKDCEGLYLLENDVVKPMGIPNQGIPYKKEPLSGDYYYMAEFYYGIDLDNMLVTLIYFIAGRWARCQIYQISADNGTYILGESSCVWVS